MSRYIDAEKLIAEVRRQKHELELSVQSQGDYGQSCQIVAYENILSLISSLQQEQLEVDEDFFFDEVLNVYDSNGVLPPKNNEAITMLENIARHFYELGLNARKEE